MKDGVFLTNIQQLILKVYIQYIINLLNTRSDINNITWHIQNYNLENTNRITSKLQRMGFQGQIVAF